MLGPARSVGRALAMGVWSVAFTEAALLRLRRVPEPERTQIRQAWVQNWAGGLLHVFGVQHQFSGESTGRAVGRPRLVVANHRSPLDIILMLRGFGGSVLGRHDLAGWPVLGRAAREGGTIFVDREDPHSGVKAIREIRRRLKLGQTVIVFPEGTTHRGDEVHPFQGGAFSAVRGLDVDLQPVGIAYEVGTEWVDETFGEHMLRVAQRAQTRVAVCVGSPLPARGQREAMAEELRTRVQLLVLQARRELEERTRDRAGLNVGAGQA